MSEEIERYKEKIDIMVGISIDEKLFFKLKEYEHVTRSFSSFFGQDDLASLLDRKADIELISRLQDQKAN